MAYINSDFQKALDTLQAWSSEISLAVSACLSTEDETPLATYFAQIPEDVLVEIRHCAGLFHAASLALSALAGAESGELSVIRGAAKDIDNFAGFLLYILDNAAPERVK